MTRQFKKNWKTIQTGAVLNIFFKEVRQSKKKMVGAVKQAKTFLKALTIFQKLMLVYLLALGVLPLVIVSLFWLGLLSWFVYMALLWGGALFSQREIPNYPIELWWKVTLACSKVLSLVLKPLSGRWWLGIAKARLVAPLNAFLCRVLEGEAKKPSPVFEFLERIPGFLMASTITLNNNWRYVYKPQLKAGIRSIKTIKVLIRVNWKSYLPAVVVKKKFLIRSMMRLCANHWFWLFFLRFEFLNLLLLRKASGAFYCVFNLGATATFIVRRLRFLLAYLKKICVHSMGLLRARKVEFLINSSYSAWTLNLMAMSFGFKSFVQLAHRITINPVSFWLPLMSNETVYIEPEKPRKALRGFVGEEPNLILFALKTVLVDLAANWRVTQADIYEAYFFLKRRPSFPRLAVWAIMEMVKACLRRLDIKLADYALEARPRLVN